MGTFSIWHWILVLVIIILIFGTNKIKTIGQDLGEAIKNFKQSLNDYNTKDKSDEPTKKDDTTK